MIWTIESIFGLADLDGAFNLGAKRLTIMGQHPALQVDVGKASPGGAAVIPKSEVRIDELIVFGGQFGQHHVGKLGVRSDLQ